MKTMNTLQSHTNPDSGSGSANELYRCGVHLKYAHIETLKLPLALSIPLLLSPPGPNTHPSAPLSGSERRVLHCLYLPEASPKDLYIFFVTGPIVWPSSQNADEATDHGAHLCSTAEGAGLGLTQAMSAICLSVSAVLWARRVGRSLGRHRMWLLT